MKILTYACQSFDPAAWHFSKVNFGKINLLVGDTATGKTRFLNTVFNLGRFGVANEFRFGMWEIVFRHNGKTYKWILETDKKEPIIIKDNLWEVRDGVEIPLVERNETVFVFNHKELPKLSKAETSVFLLREEDMIKPICEGFSNIKRRRFQQEALIKVSSYQKLLPNIIKKIEKDKTLKTIFSLDLNLNANLFFLSKYFKDIFEKICNTYQAVFPFIGEIKIRELSQIDQNISTINLIPVFCVKEKTMDVKIIIQHFCIETWGLANRKVIRPHPHSEKLLEFVRFFHVRVRDPELLPPYPKDGLNRSQFAEKYLRLAINDKFRNLTYTKKAPYAILHPSYFAEVKNRFLTTHHISSFEAFLSAFIE